MALVAAASVVVLGPTARLVLDSGPGALIYGPNACNDNGGNPYIEDAVIDLLPEGSFRGYLNTGQDCDDRRTGSVAAGWNTTHPKAVVDRLVGHGFTRADPAEGTPDWYIDDSPPSDPTAFGACLSGGHDPWQDLRRDLVPSPACSHPGTTAIVLTTTQDKREFTVRINRQGFTVDARHL